MPIRPLNTLTVEEVLQLINTPDFFDCFEFAYDIYHLRQRFVQLATVGDFAVRDPPAPDITHPNDHAFGGLAAPIADFGAPNALSAADPISDLVASTLTQAPPIPQQQQQQQQSWDQLAGGSYQGADRVAPFDMEAAPMGPGINVGQDQTLNSLVYDNYNFTPAQAALPQLADLGNGSGMNDNWDLLFGTALYNGGTAQEPGPVQDPSYDPLSPPPAQTQTPVSDSDASMAEASSSDSGPFSPESVAYNGGSSDKHEDSSSDESLDN